MSASDIPADNDPFPFGEYKKQGKTYEQVPADYLDWLDGQPWIDKWPKVKAYIAANRSVIDDELKKKGKI